jgi:hypothetical protein
MLKKPVTANARLFYFTMSVIIRIFVLRFSNSFFNHPSLLVLSPTANNWNSVVGDNTNDAGIVLHFF